MRVVGDWAEATGSVEQVRIAATIAGARCHFHSLFAIRHSLFLIPPPFLRERAIILQNSVAVLGRELFVEPLRDFIAIALGEKAPAAREIGLISVALSAVARLGVLGHICGLARRRRHLALRRGLLRRPRRRSTTRLGLFSANRR